MAILTTVKSSDGQSLVKLIEGTLRELGWVEGRNVVYDRVFAEGDATRLPELAAALVTRKPDLIFVQNNPEALAAFGKTRSIPIVFSAVADPVEIGLVRNLARPGGNVTGVATIGAETGSKRMQLLGEVLPKLARVGVLVKSVANSVRELKLIEEAARPGVKIIPAMANEAKELDAAFALLTGNRSEALVLTQVAFFYQERRRILAFAAKQRIPVIAQRSEFTDDGALISYNSSLTEQMRRAAQLGEKILKGTKPADIPVEQPTKFELVVNLRAAKALGITIPQTVLLQASRVIE